ncbi:MAG: ArdC-like ssDNA-binding domain-containing protein [Gallionella sp.]
MQEKSNRPDWHSLFEQALTQPGIISKAYSVFYEYSIGNAFLAASQLNARNLPITPIATFNKWKELGRMVKKGEKAVAMVMPVTVKSKSKNDGDVMGNEEGNQTSGSGRTIFVLKNNWFSLGQTEGAEYAHEVVIPTWDKAKALSSLGITKEPFAHPNGNVQGYAMPTAKILAINPVAAMPWKTLFHEMAHCLLHADSAQLADHELTPKDIKEAEAESVAYLCCATLELPGLEESRGYIQNWLGSSERSDEFKKRSASRVFSAANKILKAGCVKEEGAA